MRLTVLQPTLVAGAATLADAMERVFGDAALRVIHGESLVHTQWAPAGPRRMERTVRFDIDLKGMPDALKRFFRDERLRVDTRQRVYAQRVKEGSLHIHNKIHMHFVGRELFIVRPRFRLVPAPDGRGVTLMGEVESHAMLPPPICNVVEAFMDASARDSLDRLLAVASPPLEVPAGPNGPPYGPKGGDSEAEAIARIALGMGVIDGC